MLKSLRKNIHKKNLSALKKLLLLGIVTSSLTLYNGVAFADPEDGEETVDEEKTEETTDEQNTETGETETTVTEDLNLDDVTTGDDYYSGNEIIATPDYIIVNGYRVNKGESITVNGRTYTYDFDLDFKNTINGGKATFDEATNNSITITGGKFNFDITGGEYTGKVTSNTFTFNDTDFTLNLREADSYNLSFEGNTFTINGGTHSNSYVSMPNATSTNNTFNISGNPDLSNAYIYSNYFGDVKNASGNTLNIYSTGISAQNIYGFDNLNFHIPDGATSGDTMLTLTNGSTSIEGNAITAYVGGGSTLTTGDYVNLLSNSNGLSGTPSSSNVSFAEGVSLLYDANITSDGNNLIMTLGDARVNEDSKAAAQSIDNASANISRGTDRVIDWLPPEELEEAVAEGDDDTGAATGQIAAIINKSFGVFANMDAGKIKTKTGNNSYIESKTGGVDLGFARAVESQSGNTWVFAPLFDYGKSDFDSYLPNNTKGTGTSKYFAGGLIGRRIQSNGFYYEASFRGGRSTTDFNFTSEFLKQGGYNTNPNIGYHASAPVFAGHVRLGKILRMDKNNLLHVYGIYAHNHINGITANLSSGDTYDFDSVDSGKFRIGYRLTTRVSGLSKIYTGLAYQYEFNGSTDAKVKGYSTASSEVKGSSGMLELGWQMHANKRSAWVVDFNATGWIGIQKGLTGSIRIKKSF